MVSPPFCCQIGDSNTVILSSAAGPCNSIKLSVFERCIKNERPGAVFSVPGLFCFIRSFNLNFRRGRCRFRLAVQRLRSCRRSRIAAACSHSAPLWDVWRVRSIICPPGSFGAFCGRLRASVGVICNSPGQI